MKVDKIKKFDHFIVTLDASKYGLLIGILQNTFMAEPLSIVNKVSGCYVRPDEIELAKDLYRELVKPSSS